MATTGTRRAAVWAAAAAGAGVTAAPAAWAAGGPPTYGLDWKTIGDPGNRDTNAKESDLSIPIGGVDYSFRMTTTEVTVGQWFEFVQAYLPYYEGTNFSDPAFGGDYILFGVDNGEVVGAYIDAPSKINGPANMGWEYAARYVNWLHNGKASEEWAFESGVYDTSTFVKDENGDWQHQAERSPGATFWIPSLDEWTKAAYWDPEKDGGEGGYWQYPHQSDEPPIPGLPTEGGQTNAGAGGLPWDSGSYPDADSPWGLLDLSGGRPEWLENVAGIPQSRLWKGSMYGTNSLGDDVIDDVGTGLVFFGSRGLRVAAAVPAPASALTISVFLLAASRRRRAH